ncbi:MAG: hypothetical protein AB7U38_13765 [Hyphomicrobiales bacterium]
MTMPRIPFILVALVVAFSPIATWAAVQAFSGPDDGLECAGRRVVAYGWTNDDRSRAEMGAILRWQYVATHREKITSEWHLARNPWLSCRRIGGDDGQYQCKAAALPCRFPEREGAVAEFPPPQLR